MRNALGAKKLISFLSIVLLIAACSEGGGEETLFDKEDMMTINGSEVFVKQMAYGTSESSAFEKEPLVIVHGGPVLDHSYFLPYLNELGRDFRLIFYDQRACGRSSVAIDSASMDVEGFVGDIDVLREQLGFEKINLMAHSWGGLLGMKYAHKYRNRLDKLILSNSIAPSVADYARENAALGLRVTEADKKDRQALLSAGGLLSDDPREAVKTLLMQSFKYQMYDSANLSKLQFNIPIDYMDRSRVFRMLSPQLSSFDLYENLGKVQVPVLLIYGESEEGPGLYGNRMASAFQNARLEVIAQSGHFPFVEQQEVFTQVVRDFLKE